MRNNALCLAKLCTVSTAVYFTGSQLLDHIPQSMELNIKIGSTYKPRQHVAAAKTSDPSILTDHTTFALQCTVQFSITNRTTVIIHFYCQFQIKNFNDGAHLQVVTGQQKLKKKCRC
jgi:hypothetical protein